MQWAIRHATDSTCLELQMSKYRIVLKPEYPGITWDCSFRRQVIGSYDIGNAGQRGQLSSTSNDFNNIRHLIVNLNKSAHPGLMDEAYKFTCKLWQYWLLDLQSSNQSRHNNHRPLCRQGIHLRNSLDTKFQPRCYRQISHPLLYIQNNPRCAPMCGLCIFQRESNCR